jgi:hypothetical protein
MLCGQIYLSLKYQWLHAAMVGSISLVLSQVCFLGLLGHRFIFFLGLQPSVSWEDMKPLSFIFVERLDLLARISQDEMKKPLASLK